MPRTPSRRVRPLKRAPYENQLEQTPLRRMVEGCRGGVVHNGSGSQRFEKKRGWRERFGGYPGPNAGKNCLQNGMGKQEKRGTKVARIFVMTTNPFSELLREGGGSEGCSGMVTGVSGRGREFLSAKFGFTLPPKGRKMRKNCTNQYKILKIDTFPAGGGEKRFNGHNDFMDIWAFLKFLKALETTTAVKRRKISCSCGSDC